MCQLTISYSKDNSAILSTLITFEKDAFYVRQSKFKKENNKQNQIVKTYSGFNWLVELLCWCGGSILLSYCGEGLRYCFLEVSLAPCCVLYRLSISIVSIVSYMLYIIVCVWSINISTKGLSCLFWSDPIVVHRVFTTKTTILLLGRKGSSPWQLIYNSYVKLFVRAVKHFNARKMVHFAI